MAMSRSSNGAQFRIIIAPKRGAGSVDDGSKTIDAPANAEHRPGYFTSAVAVHRVRGIETPPTPEFRNDRVGQREWECGRRRPASTAAVSHLEVDDPAFVVPSGSCRRH
jgi:hypothetical protein